MRLDAYLAQYYPEHSRSWWQRQILKGHVSVNAKVTAEVDFTLGEDDEVTFVSVPDERLEPVHIPVLYEDDDVIVIDKPSGILTHSKGVENEEYTVADFAREHTSFGLGTNRPGIVHRLDRGTSGVLILAKNEDSARHLQKQFSKRNVKKTYIAVTDGIPKHAKAKIDLPLARNPRIPSQFKVDVGGKEAITNYEVLDQTDSRALVELKPHTGRTHQLRVHLLYLGTPIIGDIVYGKEADRLMLHAKELELTLPSSERKTFSSPLPDDFKKLGFTRDL